MQGCALGSTEATKRELVRNRFAFLRHESDFHVLSDHESIVRGMTIK